MKSNALVKVQVAVENTKSFHREELLNVLTALVTGQGDWQTFKANMQAGYVPTIRTRKPTKRMSRQMRAWVRAEQMLAALIREEGFKVFDGMRAY